MTPTPKPALIFRITGPPNARRIESNRTGEFLPVIANLDDRDVERFIGKLKRSKVEDMRCDHGN